MAATTDQHRRRSLHPLHAIFLALPTAFFLGALLSDWAYFTSYQIQWSNFSEWLIVGGLIGGALALIWGVIDLFRTRKGRAGAYVLVLLATWVVAFFNALVHSKDAWGSMPAGLYLSVIVAILSLIAAWIGYSGIRPGDRP